MSFDTSSFVVQRGDTRYKVLGADWDTIQDGDLMIAHRGGTACKFTVGTDTWEDTDLLVCTDAAGVTRSVTGDQVPNNLVFLPDEIIPTPGQIMRGELPFYQNNIVGAHAGGSAGYLKMARMNATTKTYLGLGGAWGNTMGWGGMTVPALWPNNNTMAMAFSGGLLFTSTNQGATWSQQGNAAGAQSRASYIESDGYVGVETGFNGSSGYNTRYTNNGTSYINRGSSPYATITGAGTNSNAWGKPSVQGQSRYGWMKFNSKTSSSTSGQVNTAMLYKNLQSMQNMLYFPNQTETGIMMSLSDVTSFSNEANHQPQTLPPEVAGRKFAGSDYMLRVEYGDSISTDAMVVALTVAEVDKPNYAVYKRITETEWKVKGIEKLGAFCFNPKTNQLVFTYSNEEGFHCYNLA